MIFYFNFELKYFLKIKYLKLFNNIKICLITSYFGSALLELATNPQSIGNLL